MISHTLVRFISQTCQELGSMKEEVDQYKELEAKERDNVEKAEANFTSVQAGNFLCLGAFIMSYIRCVVNILT